MRNARNLILFLAGIAAGFVYICNAIPQIQTEAVVEEPVSDGTPEELSGAGKRIFMSDRAQCLTCHSLGEDPKARCPNQEGLGERAATRIPGMGAADYIVESLYNPNAYIVSGYPRNQMQPVNKPPIALSHDEILALIAYLNTLGASTDTDFLDRARKAQDPWRRGLRKPEEGRKRFHPPLFQGNEKRGREVFQEQGCITCHRVGPDGQDVGPELTRIGAAQTPAYILESILDPGAVIVRGFKETIVMWKQPGRYTVRGIAVEWLPDQEYPETLRLSVRKGGEQQETDIDLAQASYVGDTIVVVEREGISETLCGAYVSGDENTGITLSFLEDGGWTERRIPPETIDIVNPAMSPMPENFAELMTPAMFYDLVAFLLAQKGES